MGHDCCEQGQLIEVHRTFDAQALLQKKPIHGSDSDPPPDREAHMPLDKDHAIGATPAFNISTQIRQPTKETLKLSPRSFFASDRRRLGLVEHHIGMQ
jgi:hypothetical protein